jgi:hypothetical protein
MVLTIGYIYRTIVEYLLAGMMFLSGLAGLHITMQGNDPGVVAAIQLWILGAVLVLVGIIQFILFIQKNPLQKEDSDAVTG